MSDDEIATLSMAEIIRLQDRLSQELKRRFEKHLALAFSDIVGSTSYFERFGDEAGRKLQQRHFDFAQQALAAFGGRIVDTAGDGIFMALPDADAAAAAVVAIQREISRDNLTRSREHQISVRIGFHAGPVLTDGNHVTGDAVNLAARVAGSSSWRACLSLATASESVSAPPRRRVVTHLDDGKQSHKLRRHKM